MEKKKLLNCYILYIIFTITININQFQNQN